MRLPPLMETRVKKLLLIAAFAVSSSLFGAIGVGIEIGAPPAVRVERRPVMPGPGYVWVDGYWYANGPRWAWHRGYWSRPPYEGAAWVAPRYEGGRFFEGYWNGPHGQLPHDHRWDRDHDRDYNRH